MFQQLPSIQRLIRQLQKIPYLASKNVYRVALFLIKSDQKFIDLLCKILLETKAATKLCLICENLTETNNICTICRDPKRDKSTICVVETWHDLFAIERAGEYQGVYHILGGALCPLEGIGPDELSISSLLKRLNDKNMTEIIFATNPTPEGEATASYIVSKIKKIHTRISKLASGVPIGSNLEFIDRITISKALSGRQSF